MDLELGLKREIGDTLPGNATFFVFKYVVKRLYIFHVS